MDLNEKYRLLSEWLLNQGSLAVAFSGGVDSTFLLAAAKDVLKDKVMALSVKTPYIPDWEIKEAARFCREKEIRHVIINESIIPEIAENPENRCYLCKRHIFTLLMKEAETAGFLVLADGSNLDDTRVYRPGLAALKELEIKSPLLEAGITKAEVRELSKRMGLATADKPSYACLLTRMPYNYKIEISELERVERAEQFLASIGYANSRVRNHHELARIEVDPGRIAEFVNTARYTRLILFFRGIGYKYVTVDMEGYRSGSFDSDIKQN